MTSELTQLFNAVNDILGDLEISSEAGARFMDDAINWGDLSCVSAEHFCDHNGQDGFRVWIEEADPNASYFQEFVRKKLAERGFQNVDVRTEW